MKEGRWGPATALAHSACLTSERVFVFPLRGSPIPTAWQLHSRPGWGQRIPPPILASWLFFGTCQWEALEEIKGQEGERGFPRCLLWAGARRVHSPQSTARRQQYHSLGGGGKLLLFWGRRAE